MRIPACEPDACAPDVAVLNRDCRCITLDATRLKAALETDPRTGSLHRLILETRPHLFASLPVFLARDHIAQMRAVVRAAEAVIALPGYRHIALARAPQVATRDPGPRGVFLSYDFHLGPDGPRLIEINTNAGGALLNAVLARAQRACCAEIEPFFIAPGDGNIDKEELFLAMFRAEWRRQHGSDPLRRVAIVDDDPQSQYLWPEFELFRQLFERAGYEAVIADARALVWSDGRLSHDGGPIDLVYNRTTDFYFEQPAHAALRAAYLHGAAAVTPHPHAYALYADKRNLVALSAAASLAAMGASSAVIGELAARVPRAVELNEMNAADLWTNRRRLFFKPSMGYGSRATYRGDKLTRRVWEEIVAAGSYIAQERVEPSGRRVLIGNELIDLKVDLRCYVYAGEIQLVAARLYQGQTTNFRTPGGGFAPVFTAVP